MLVAEGKMLRPDHRFAGVVMHVDRRGRDFPKQHPGGHERDQNCRHDRAFMVRGEKAHTAAHETVGEACEPSGHTAVFVAPCYGHCCSEALYRRSRRRGLGVPEGFQSAPKLVACRRGQSNKPGQCGKAYGVPQSAISDSPAASSVALSPRVDAVSAAVAVRPAPELSIVVPTFNEKANIPILVERLAQLLTDCDVGGYFRRRQFARRNGRRSEVHRYHRQSRPLHSPHRPARTCRRVPRGHAGKPGPLCGGDGCGPAARRRLAGADAGSAARRARRRRGGEPLSGWRLQRRTIEAALPCQPRLECAGAALARHRADRSDERSFHDSPRCARNGGAVALDAGLQDPARHSGDRARQHCVRSNCRRPSASASTARASSIPRSRSTSPRW